MGVTVEFMRDELLAAHRVVAGLQRELAEAREDLRQVLFRVARHHETCAYEDTRAEVSLYPLVERLEREESS